ncbi:putative reverse transcriptase domain-containing protein [Tanacetum coccineum]
MGVEDLQLGVESYQKKLNLTKPDTYRSNLRRRDAYTPYSDPRGFIYENKDKKNRLMRIDELHKFSDGTLDDVRTALNDRLKGIRMEYLPQTFWSQRDKANARAMIQAIDKRLKTRRIMRSLERFVGGRPYGGFNTTAGNPVKKILLKLNLSDHRSILTDLKIAQDHNVKYKFNVQLNPKLMITTTIHREVKSRAKAKMKHSILLEFYNTLVDLGASVSVMPLSTYLNVGLGELAHTKLIVELVDRIVKYPKGIAKNVLVGIGKFLFPIDFIILDMLEDIKLPLILKRPFLSTTRAKIDVFKRKITLRVGEERIIFKSVKPASSLIKRVYMLSLRERMELDLEARLMGETLVLNKSLDPLDGDYIELNDLNEPIELRRNQGNDLMPTIEEGKVIEEFRTRDDKLDTGIDDYPSFEFLHANFSPILYVNVMSKKFHNSIMRDKMEYKGNNIVGALMNVPIFVGTFSVVTNFEVLKDMDAYRDEGMGDVIFGEPFLREIGINARRFDGMITIYNGNDEVTYQMVRSHLMFIHYTNKQCNKIPPLLEVSEEDKMNGISHSYHKLKGFYKGVLNVGPEYIRDAKMEEWLTAGT